MWPFRSRKPRPPARPRPARRPRLEALEDRCLLSAGALDPTFGSGGTVTTQVGKSSSVAWGLAVQANGQIVTAGVANTSSGQNFAVVRYNGNGSLDAAFGSKGSVLTSPSRYGGSATGAVVQPDGKIVAAGISNGPINSQGFADNAFAVVRYNANGSL